MQSLVVSILSEIHNLENEVIVLLQVEPSSNEEDSTDVLETCIAKIKTRLTTIMMSFSKLLEENKNSKPVELSSGSFISGEEVVISAMSVLFVNLFLRISLKFNCNLSASRVLLNKLSQDTEEGSSIQTMFVNLLDKVIESNE